MHVPAEFEDKCIPVNDEEHRILTQFKARTSGLNVDEKTLIRFLRARDHNISKAEEMVKKNVAWRAQHNVDNILDLTMPEEVVKKLPFSHNAKDKDGRVIAHLPCGIWEIRELVGLGYSDHMRKYMIIVMEKYMKALKTSEFERFTIVVDLTGMTYHKIAHYETVQLILLGCKYFEENYPERMNRVFIVNAPWIFSYLYSLIKPLMGGKTIKKIEIFDTNSTKYRPVLEELISSDYLDDIFNVCPDRVQATNENSIT